MIHVSTTDYIAYDQEMAARLLNVSVNELSAATARGDLVARWAGAKATKPLYFREDLVDWVEALPTARGGE